MTGLRKPQLLSLVVGCAILLGIALGACGGSGSDAPDQAQLEGARKEGEEAAREKERVSRLEQQVNHLKKQVHRQEHPTTATGGESTRAVTAAPPESSPSVLRSFHAPSGNVSCEILSDGALCSVDSIGETFVFRDGQAAHIESGLTLSEGSGELAPYGTVISSGSITCTIPRSDEPRGVTCGDSETGHGFEASRVPARQKAY